MHKAMTHGTHFSISIDTQIHVKLRFHGKYTGFCECHLLKSLSFIPLNAKGVAPEQNNILAPDPVGASRPRNPGFATDWQLL